MKSKLGVLLGYLLFCGSAYGGSFYIGGGVGVSNVDDRADTDSNIAFGVVSAIPTTLPLNGFAYDSSETLGTIVAGWNVRDWFALELGYAELGEFAQSFSVASFSAVSILNPPIPFPPGTTLFPTLPQLPPSIPANLDVREWSIAAKFSKPLVSRLSANWSVGATHAEFDTRGRFSFFRQVSANPLEFEPTTISFLSPGNETGFNYGFGFAWDFNDRFSTDIGYKKHDAQVVEVETLALRFIVNL